MISRNYLVKIHMLLAAFVFPVAFMFLITGGLYTWGFKGSYNSETYTVSLASPLVDDQEVLEALVRSELERLSIAVPSGSASVKTGGTSFKLEWTGSDKDVVLEPTADSLSAKLTVKDTTWYRHLVQLHKAKGGQLFKIYAAVLAISLAIILFSGFLMAWQVPKYRKLAAIFSTAGIGTFLLMVSAS